MSERAKFSSKLGLILTSAGSAVGLGNIWRFPTEVGMNGGAVFILIYILCVIFLGLPLMVSEFLIGRRTHANTIDAYRILAPRSPWVFQGFLGVFTAWFILCYYCVVTGWTLKYLYDALAGNLQQVTDAAAHFSTFTSSTWAPLVFMAIALIITHCVIIRGVQNGIERCSKVLMPLLLLIIAILLICSFSMPGSSKGLRFLLQPDFSKISSRVILSAMGQAFFSLSIAMGCLCTYGSYFRDDAKLINTARSVAVIDTTVAVMSGFIIFPAVFSIANVAPDAGPGLVFITLPDVFRFAFSSVPWLGTLFSVMFYLLLVLAAITSMISLHEPVTAFLHEHYHLSRRHAAYIVTGVALSVGTLCALSFGVLKDFGVIGNMTFFDTFDFISAKIFLPVGGIIISLFIGWRLDRHLVVSELTNQGRLKLHPVIIHTYLIIVRWVAPLAIALIFLNELGLFK